MRRSATIALAVSLFTAMGCGLGSSPSGDGSAVVFAAASLTETFTEIGDMFTARTGIEVEFNFASSSDLAAQIEQGAVGDVFASADEVNMRRLLDGDLAHQERIFARNLLEIAVRPGNPHDIGSLEDLEDDDLVVSVCSEACPAGRYARELFEKNDVRIRPDSREVDVRAVLTRVATGEADAGIVYRTDVMATDDVVGVPIPEANNVVASYPIVALRSGTTPEEFVTFVLNEGRPILEEHGFLPP